MRGLRAALAVIASLSAGEGLLWLASRAGGPVVFDVGPSTGAYHSGFTPSEERPPTTFRWSRDRATILLPLDAAAGPGTLTIRFQGFLREAVATHVLLGGRHVASFPAPSGRFQLARLPVQIPAGRLRIDILPEGPVDPGIAVDWIRLEGARFVLPFSVWGPRLLVGGSCVVALLAGFTATGAFASALVLASCQAAWAAVDPFAVAHVSTRAAAPALVLCLLTLALFRARPHVRWVMLALLASYLTKAAALFHPCYFYNDVRNNRRYVQALGSGEGPLLVRSHQAKVRIGVAYPRIVAGKKYAFPYSPVFFLPFTLLTPDPLVIDEAMKHVVLALAAAEVLLAYWLAGLVLGPASGLAAAWLAAMLPILVSRLLLTLWSTLGGHFFDGLLLGCAILMLASPTRAVRVLAFAAAAQASLLTYVASLFNVTLFSGFLALLARRHARRVLLVWALASGLTLYLLYRDFVVTFVSEILPAVLGGGLGPQQSIGSLALLAHQLGRFRLFYGFVWVALALLGLALVQRRARPHALPPIAAYGLAFGCLVLLRSLPGGLFKDLKEMEFVAPLMAILTGVSLEALWERGRAARAGAILLAGWLLAFSVSRYHEYLTTWTALAEL